MTSTKDPAFRQSIGGGYPAARSLILSLFVHGIAVAVGIVTFSARIEPAKEMPAPAQPTVIRIDTRIFRVARISTSARLSTRPAAAGKKSTEKRANAPAARAFVPPEVKKNLISEATLIQPLLPPDVVAVVPPLPSFRVWTSQLQVPKLAKPFVAPGRPTAAPPEQAPALTPPQIELNAGPMPRMPAGDPVNILSLNDRPVPPTDKLVVPAVNVVGRLGEGIGAGGKGTASGLEGGSGLANRPTPPGVPSTLAIALPASGDFDAVVVQSSNLDQFPETKNLLPGRPIYTVYISTGTAKNWALYFCLRGEKAPPSSQQNVVKAESAPPVQAPYPTRLVRPGIVAPAYYKYILVHGFVNSGGRFENLRVVRPTKPETDEALIASLAGWEFRPATEDGVKVAVEFVLSIPVSGL